MIYGPLNGEMATFAYDCRNRLTEVQTDSGETTKYAYDAENIRTKVIKNAGIQKESITTYVTDSVSHELSRVLIATTTDKAGNTENILYTYGNGLVAQENGKEYLLYHFDHLGSTTAVTDASGKIKYTYTYNIFGKLLSGNYGEVEFLYNGQYGVTSDANGLYYMRARYYNIDIMRFINQDILTGSIDSSQSLNRYAYVEGNPVNFLDPFGLAREIYTMIHTINKTVKDLCTATEIALGLTIIITPETAPVAVPLFLKVANVQITVQVADMLITIVEVIDIDNMSEQERRNKIAGVIYQSIIAAAMEVLAKTDPSFAMQVE